MLFDIYFVEILSQTCLKLILAKILGDITCSGSDVFGVLGTGNGLIIKILKISRLIHLGNFNFRKRNIVIHIMIKKCFLFTFFRFNFTVNLIMILVGRVTDHQFCSYQFLFSGVSRESLSWGWYCLIFIVLLHFY